MTATLRARGNTYYAIISYKDGGKNKQKWISLGIPVKNNKRRAEAMLDDVKLQFQEKYSTPNGDMQFADFIAQWVERKKPLVELSTWEGYEIYAHKHIIPYFRDLGISLRDLKPHHIKAYYDYKFINGRLDGKPGGLSIAAIKKHASVITSALDEAVLYEYITKNPATGLRMPAKNIPSIKENFLTSDEANVMLKAFSGHPLEALVYVTLYYGLRRSEALGLRWSAIDFEKNTLSINHTVVKNRTIEHKDSTKTQASRATYVLLDDVRDVLLAHKKRQEENKKEFGAAYVESDYVFTWNDGRLFRPDYVTRGFQRVLKANGFPHMRFHDLRHSTASILYEKGWDLKDSQSWMRHASVKMTGDTYTHIKESRKIKMANDMNSTFHLKSTVPGE